MNRRFFIKALSAAAVVTVAGQTQSFAAVTPKLTSTATYGSATYGSATYSS